MFSPSAPNSIAWLKNTSSCGSRPVTASTKKAGTPGSQEWEKKLVCWEMMVRHYPINSSYSLWTSTNINITYQPQDCPPLLIDLGVFHWLRWQNNTGNLRCCLLPKEAGLLFLMITDAVTHWLNYLTYYCIWTYLIDFLYLPITLKVRFPSLLAWIFHWPGCIGGSSVMR